MNSLEQRCAELTSQLAALNRQGRTTALGSPEQQAVLKQWAAVHAALSALKEELEEPEKPELREQQA
jgi:DNA-binding FrmR family transcriptional regulator